MAISSFLARTNALKQRYYVGSDGWTVFTPSAAVVNSSGTTLANGTRIIYVSDSDGNNANDGLSPATPKKAMYDIAGSNGAYRLLRDAAATPAGGADWVLFKRGDTFSNGFTALASPNMTINGRSRLEPMLFGAYGPNANPTTNPFGDDTGARPIIQPDSSMALNSTVNLINAQSLSPGSVVFKSLEFYDYRVDPDSPSTGIVQFRGSISSGTNTITGVTNFTNLTVGMRVVGHGTRTLTVSSFDSVAQTITLSSTVGINVSDCLFMAYFPSVNAQVSFGGHNDLIFFEDCYFHYTQLAINGSSGPTLSNYQDLTTVCKGLQIILRRNVFWHGYFPLGGGANIFMGDMPTQTYPTIVEENLLYMGGWHSDVMATECNGTTHNAYCHDLGGNHVFASNITAEASANGYMQRTGGRVYNNTFIANTVGGTSSTGIYEKAVNVHENVFVQGSGGKAINLIATAISTAGSTTITVDRLVSSTAGSFASQITFNSTSGSYLENLDNPGSLPTSGSAPNVTVAGSLSGRTITLGNGSGSTQTVAAGTRGNGVQVGDRIRVYQSMSGNAWNTFASLSWPICSPPDQSGNYTYPIGSNTFYVPWDKPIPSWVAVGHKVVTNGAGGSAYGTGSGTISAIASDRRSFTTTETTTAGLLAAYGQEFTGGHLQQNQNLHPQNVAVFWDPTDLPGSKARYPQYRVGPNNIFVNCDNPVDGNGTLTTLNITINSDASGNYFYKWKKYSTASNVDTATYVTSGMNSGWDTASQTFCANTGLTGGDNMTVEGYMTSLGITPATKDEFYARCRDNRKGSFDSRFTAIAFNNYIRGLWTTAGYSISTITPTYPAWNYNTAS